MGLCSRTRKKASGMDGRRWGLTDPTKLCRHVRELRFHGGSSVGRHWRDRKKGDSSEVCVPKLPLGCPMENLGRWGVKGRAGQSGARQTREENTPWVQVQDVGGFKTQPHMPPIERWALHALLA